MLETFGRQTGLISYTGSPERMGIRLSKNADGTFHLGPALTEL